MDRYLLDTTVFGEYARRQGNPRVRAWINSLLPLQRWLCPITLGEFWVGALGFPDNVVRHRERRVVIQARKWEWRDIDENVAKVWAAAKLSLPPGVTIESNDLWLAAVALRFGLVVATRNVRHFRPVEALSVFNPFRMPDQ